MCTDTGELMQAGATALQAYGQYEEAHAANVAAEFNADIAERNAQLAEAQSADALARGRAAESKHMTAVRRLLGRQVAGYAAGGVSVQSGSAQEVRRQTEYYGRIDALTIRHAAAKEAWGYDVQAGSYRTQAALYRSQWRNPWIAPAATMLSGFSKMYAQQQAKLGRTGRPTRRGW